MPDQGVTLNARIQYKKDTDANWTSNNPVLLENELVIVEMENGECRFKIGDGTHPYVELPFISLGFSGVLGIEQGGTGANDATQARSNLGAAAEEHKHSASDITSGGTIKGNVTVDGTFVSNAILPANKSTTQIPLIYLPRLSYNDLNVSISNPSEFLQAWLKWVCQHYNNYTTGSIYLGSILPSSQSIIFCYIYNTQSVDAESGLPQYCNGFITDQSKDRTIRTFGTTDYNFSTTILGSDLAYSTGVLQIEHGGTGGTTKQTAREGLGFTQVGNSTTPVYFNSNAFPVACTPYSSASVASAAKLTTSRTIRTNLSSTSTASFNGTANITPGITGTLAVSHGGTGGASVDDARYNLGVPAEIDVADGSSGFPFTYGSVVCRGYKGNTIGQSEPGDNYYWGVDSTATLWGGKQTNSATSVTWKKALMMDGSQDHQRIWSGNLTGTGSITLTNATKYAALILCGFPGGSDADLQFTCVPAGSASSCQFCSNQYWFSYSLTSSGNNITIKIIENPSSGSFRFCWGVLRHTP